MSLRQAFVGARLLEAAENYARAGFSDAVRFASASGDYADGWEEAYFWQRIGSLGERARGATVNMPPEAVLSEWVARVPGLYWQEGSKALRSLTEAAVEDESQGWKTYQPFGKSQRVSGGIGTLRLPASAGGFRLATLTMSLNVSAGIPLLVPPDVWEHHRLAEGCVVSIRGNLIWQSMDMEWASRFPIVRGIPRGYLVVRHPDEISVAWRAAPTQIHPFTIMQYYQGTAELFDFVYATASTDQPDYRSGLSQFFASYKDRSERHGRYLTAADVLDPLWDAEFLAPEDLRHAPGAQPHLRLLSKRIEEKMLGHNQIESMQALLGKCYDQNGLQRISDVIGIPPAVWFAGGTVAAASAALLDAVTARNKLAELVETVGIEYPEHFAA